MKGILATGLALGMTGSLLAGGNGGSAGMFLTLPSGARSASLGEGGVALSVDASALHLNPGAMGSLEVTSVVGTHGAYIDSSFFDHITYVNPKGKIGAWGVGVQYFGAGSIDGTDEGGDRTGNLSPNDLALTVGYARSVGRVGVGAGLKYVRSKLAETASTVSLDLGVASKPLMKGKLSLALVGENLMGRLKYDQESNDLPMAVKAGAGYAVKGNWDVVLDGRFARGEDSDFSVGTEYRLRWEGPWGLALRGGYNTRTNEVDGLTGVSLGVGVRRRAMTVDYAFLPFGDVGSTHWITLGWRMGGGAVERWRNQ